MYSVWSPLRLPLSAPDLLAKERLYQEPIITFSERAIKIHMVGGGGLFLKKENNLWRYDLPTKTTFYIILQNSLFFLETLICLKTILSKKEKIFEFAKPRFY